MKGIILFLLFMSSAYAWEWEGHGSGTIQTMQQIHEQTVAIATDGDTDNLFLMNMKTKEVLWSFDPNPGGQGSWGNRNLLSFSDINGDGFKEVVWGTAWGDRTVYMMDGQTGKPIWKFNTFAWPNGSSESGWILDVKTIQDLDGDGITDLVFNVGQKAKTVAAVSGKNGKLLWQFNQFWDSPTVTTVMDDIDGDGFQDVVVSTSSYDERTIALSGRFGEKLLWRFDQKNTVFDALIGDDLNLDGKREVITSDWGGNIIALDAVTGVEVWSQNLERAVMIQQMNNRFDSNGDGIKDIVIGSHSNTIYLLDGSNGDILQEWTPEPTVGRYWTVSMMKDLNGNGSPEIVAGSFSGKAFIYDSVSGEQLRALTAGIGKALTLTVVSDQNGNGKEELIVGTQESRARGEQKESGKVYFFQN